MGHEPADRPAGRPLFSQVYPDPSGVQHCPFPRPWHTPRLHLTAPEMGSLSPPAEGFGASAPLTDWPTFGVGFFHSSRLFRAVMAQVFYNLDDSARNLTSNAKIRSHLNVISSCEFFTSLGSSLGLGSQDASSRLFLAKLFLQSLPLALTLRLCLLLHFLSPVILLALFLFLFLFFFLFFKRWWEILSFWTASAPRWKDQSFPLCSVSLCSSASPDFLPTLLLFWSSEMKKMVLS